MMISQRIEGKDSQLCRICRFQKMVAVAGICELYLEARIIITSVRHGVKDH